MSPGLAKRIFICENRLSRGDVWLVEGYLNETIRVNRECHLED
jgi:hypothetical protein